MGWRAKAAFCVLVGSCQVAGAVTFEPKVEDVCLPSAQKPGVLVLDREALLAQLVQTTHGINTVMMKVSAGGAIYDREVQIVENPSELCGVQEGACKAADNKKLGEAIIELANFFNRHRQPIDPKKGGFDTRGLAVSGEGAGQLSSASIDRFLRGHVDAHAATCVKPPEQSGAAGASAGGPPAGGAPRGGTPGGGVPNAAPTPFISLRQTVDDLKYSRTSPSDTQAFKAAKPANLAASNDRIAGKYSVAVDAALGYVFPRRSFDDKGNFIGQFIPFITYDQVFVQTTSAKTSSYVQNLGAGLTGDMTVFESHNLAVTPKYVESLRNDARVFSGTFAYTPMYGIPAVDSVLYIIPNTLSFQITPQLKYIIRDVTAAGTGLTVLNPGDYSWYGGRVSLTMFGEGIMDGFTYNVGYEEYAASEGNLRRVSNFLTAIGYTFGDAKLASILLQYQRGRNLDTLESVNVFTLGLGLKY